MTHGLTRATWRARACQRKLAGISFGTNAASAAGMVSPSHIKPDMPVVCSKAIQFAAVERMEGHDWVKLKKDERGVHHFIPLSWVRLVDDKVHIDRPGKQAMQQWSATPSFGGLKSALQQRW